MKTIILTFSIIMLSVLPLNAFSVSSGNTDVPTTKVEVTFVSIDIHSKKDFFEQTKIKTKNLVCSETCSPKRIFVYNLIHNNTKIWVWTADHNIASRYNKRNLTNKYTVKYDEDLQIIHMTDHSSEYVINEKPIADDVDWNNVYQRTQQSVDDNE